MEYDVVIVGSGPAGLSAALYAARAGLSTLIAEKNSVGGLITATLEIGNYPGAPAGSTGVSLTERMRIQALEAGAVLRMAEVTSLTRNTGGNFEAGFQDGESVTSKALIAANGSKPRLLGIPGELEFRGRGVSYCATCDAVFFKGKRVAVVGGGDSAVKEGEYLTRFASSVQIIHRRDTLRASAATQRLIEGNSRLSFLYSSRITEIIGEKTVTSMRVENTLTGEETVKEVDGIFIYAGYDPDTALYEPFGIVGEAGYIEAGQDMSTAAPGLFAAGDVRVKPLRQAITAASDGAVAATSAQEYIHAGKEQAR